MAPQLDVTGRIWGAISSLGKTSAQRWKEPTAQSSVWGQCPGFGADLALLCGEGLSLTGSDLIRTAGQVKLL